MDTVRYQRCWCRWFHHIGVSGSCGGSQSRRGAPIRWPGRRKWASLRRASLGGMFPKTSSPGISAPVTCPTECSEPQASFGDNPPEISSRVSEHRPVRGDMLDYPHASALPHTLLLDPVRCSQLAARRHSKGGRRGGARLAVNKSHSRYIDYWRASPV